jgi:hypothetical protein
MSSINWHSYKLTYFILLAVLFLLAPLLVHATSGACSWHGGVDCSAGPDWDGSVICNDGWRDSTVSYYSMTMCNYGSYYNPTPSCPLFSTYDSLSRSCKCDYGYVSDGYGGCESGNTACHRKYGYNSSYKSYSGTCECDYGYVFDSSNQCVSRDDYCQDLLGYNAEYKILDSACGCRSGYVLNSSQTGCISGDTYCQNLYGYHAGYDSFSKTCECDSGYELRLGQCRIEENSYYTPIYTAVPTPTVYVPKWTATPIATPRPTPPIKTAEPTRTTLPNLTPKPTVNSPAVSIEPKKTPDYEKPKAAGSVITFLLAGRELIRECPKKDCKVLYRGSKNDLIQLLQAQDDWYKVVIEKNGQTIDGWLHSSLVPNEKKAELSSYLERKRLEEKQELQSQRGNVFIKVFKSLFKLFF